jgi:hypothetical protein
LKGYQKMEWWKINLKYFLTTLLKRKVPVSEHPSTKGYMESGGQAFGVLTLVLGGSERYAPSSTLFFTGEEAGWAPQSVWKWCRGEKSLMLPEITLR